LDCFSRGKKVQYCSQVDSFLYNILFVLSLIQVAENHCKPDGFYIF
jgi:hypothetical protein